MVPWGIHCKSGTCPSLSVTWWLDVWLTWCLLCSTVCDLSSNVALSSFPGCSDELLGSCQIQHLSQMLCSNLNTWGAALGTQRWWTDCFVWVKASLDWSVRGMLGLLGLMTTQSDSVLWSWSLTCGFRSTWHSTGKDNFCQLSSLMTLRCPSTSARTAWLLPDTGPLDPDQVNRHQVTS